MSEVVISANHLTKQYHIGYHNPFLEWRAKSIQSVKRTLYSRLWKKNSANSTTPSNVIYALNDLSFEVRRGEIVGIIGKNGAGKSTLLKILSKITRPTSGYVDICGKVGALLEVGTGFHPELSGRENVFLNAAFLGLSNEDITRRFDEIVAFAEIEKFIDTPVKYYSSGMYARLAFSVAAHLSPDILVVDEVLSVGDVGFQKKSLGKMESVVNEGRTVLIVSHSIGQIVSFCNRCIWLETGKMVMDGPTNDVVNAYQEKVQEIRYDQSHLLTSEKQSEGQDTGDTKILLNTEPVDWDEPTLESRDESNISKRYGNGKARITEISFSPVDRISQSSKKVLRCGDDLKIAITIKARDDILNAHLDLSIRDKYGNLVIFTSPITKGYALSLKPKETVTIVIGFQNLLLKPGEYILGCYLGRRGYYHIDGLLNIFKFDVEPKLEAINYDHLYPGIYECDFTLDVLRD